MPNVTLETIAEDWALENLAAPFTFRNNKIYYPCLEHFLAPIRYATIAETIRLARVNCSCVDCVRDSISISDPNAFDMLKKSLLSRVEHKSVVISADVEPGDNIQHVIDHMAMNGGSINLKSGFYYNEMIDVGNTKIIITGEATFMNCRFDNIKVGVQATSDAIFNGCEFAASPNGALFTFDV